MRMHVAMPLAIILLAGAGARSQTIDQQKLGAQWFECMEGDDPDKGIAACTDVIQSRRLSPKDLEAAYIEQAKLYRDVGQFDLAISNYTLALHSKPDDVWLLDARGTAHSEAGRYDRAIADFDRAIRVASNAEMKTVGARLFDNRGTAYLHSGQFDRAIADYTEALRTTAGWVGPLSNRGVAYDNIGKFDLAIADHDEAVRKMPENIMVLNKRGFHYDRTGEYDRAIADFTHALQIDPKTKYPLIEARRTALQRAMALFGRGLAKRHKGDTLGGEADHAAARALAPAIDAEVASWGIKP